MKKSVLLAMFFFSFILTGSLSADSSEFGFKPQRQKLQTKEDFLKLYTKWLYPDLDSVSRNVYFLELAFISGYNHPIQALTPITNEVQFNRYKYMLQMHICVLLTQEYINYGYLYMKEHIYFYNQEFKKDYQDGYDIAEFYFKCARKYWDIALEQAESAAEIAGAANKTDLFAMEDEIVKIKTGDLDYYKVLDNLMARINRNRAEMERLWGK